MPVSRMHPGRRHCGRGDGKPIHVGGDEVTIKISSSDTGGAFAVSKGGRGRFMVPPLHLHRHQDETWYISRENTGSKWTGRRIYARAGSTVFAPRGSRHTFQNIGSTYGRMSPRCPGRPRRFL